MKTGTVARDHSQNYFKALLVIGMIMIHCLQLLTRLTGITNYFSTYINLVTFSGFMFSFGYVYHLVYRDKNISFAYAWKKMRSTLFAYYFSALAWSLLVMHNMSMASFLKIILLLDLLPYSEFLIAFFLTTGIYFLFRKKIDAFLENGRTLLMVLSVLLLCCAVPYLPVFSKDPSPVQQVVYNYIGLFFGMPDRSYYPVVQYMVFFLIGGWFQSRQIGYSAKVLAASLVATLVFFVYVAITSHPPKRFPPTPLWVLGSFFFLYVYYLLARAIRFNKLNAYLNSIGENTLVYLVISNVVIFSAIKTITWTAYSALLFSVVIIFFITFIISVARKSSP